jgi:hypothetical protein
MPEPNPQAFGSGYWHNCNRKTFKSNSAVFVVWDKKEQTAKLNLRDPTNPQVRPRITAIAYCPFCGARLAKPPIEED